MSVSSSEEDLPPKGKKIILRRLNTPNIDKSLDEIISESVTTVPNTIEDKSLDEIINEKIINTTSKVSASKRKAQAYYYKQKRNAEKKPVHARIGGCVMHEQQTRNGKTFSYKYLDTNAVIEPRLKKLPNGQLMTQSYIQKAQRRLHKLRYFRAMSALKIQVKNVNAKPKYANIYHSLHDSFDSQIQELLLHIQKTTKVHDALDPDTPILVETKTSMTLHERFSSYP